MNPFEKYLAKRRAAIAQANLDAAKAEFLAERYKAGTQVNRRVYEAGLLGQNDGPMFDLQNYHTIDGIDFQSYQELQRRLFKLETCHPLGHGWIKAMVRFTVGDEFQMVSLDHDPETQKVWDEFADKNRFPMLATELVERTQTMGENFLRKYYNPHIGLEYVRFLEPLQIIEPQFNQRASFGIECDRDDITVPLRYYYDEWHTGQPKPIDADEIVHTKLGLSTAKRGRPWLLPVLQYLFRLEKMLEARDTLHIIRASCAIEEYLDESTPEGAAALAEMMKGVEAGNEQKQKAPKTGSIQRLAGGVRREYKTPNLQAQDGDHDVTRLFRIIGTGLGLHEGIVANDFSNADLASFREAAYPTIRTFEESQRFYGIGTFEPMFEEVIGSAIDRGRLKELSYVERERAKNGIIVIEREIVPRIRKARCQFPLLWVRDPLINAQATQLQRDMRLCSRRTAQAQSGFNAEEEDRQMEVEAIKDEQKMPGTAQAHLDAALAAADGTDKADKADGKAKPNGKDNNGTGNHATSPANRMVAVR